MREKIERVGNIRVIKEVIEKNYEWRDLTEKEKDKLLNYYKEHSEAGDGYGGIENPKSFLESAYYKAIDGFITGCPNYAGDLIVVIYDALTVIEVFKKIGNELQRVRFERT